MNVPDIHIKFDMATSSHLQLNEQSCQIYILSFIWPYQTRYKQFKFHMAISLSQISLDKNVLNVIQIKSDMATSSQM